MSLRAARTHFARSVSLGTGSTVPGCPLPVAGRWATSHRVRAGGCEPARLASAVHPETPWAQAGRVACHGAGGWAGFSRGQQAGLPAAPNPTRPWDSCRPWLHLNFQTLPGSPGQASPASSAEVTGKITRDQAPPRPTPCASPARTRAHPGPPARRAALPDSWECRAGGSAPAVRVDHSGKALGQS